MEVKFAIAGIVVDFDKKKPLKKSTLPKKKSTFLAKKKAPISQTKSTFGVEKKHLVNIIFVNKK